MKPKTTFYQARHLPTPQDEFWPRDRDALKALVLEKKSAYGRVIFGGGQHTRARLLGARPYEAVRTDHCSRILEIDRDSSIVRVEAGVRWGDLQENLHEHGYSLENYRPYPDAASIGGLLAKQAPGPPYWLSGDIRSGCAALSAISPKLGEYTYLEAPRKAAGPDLRHLFMGGEGQFGAILDVTLHVQRSFPARLMSWEAPRAREAILCMKALASWGMHPNWAYWKRSAGQFRAVFHAPTKLLDGVVDRLQADSLTRDTAALMPAPLIEGDTAAREFRRELQWEMPEQRSQPGAARTVAITMSLARLADGLDGLKDVEEIEILDWSAHAATAYIRFKGDEASRGPAQKLTPEIRQQAMAIRPIVDSPGVNEEDGMSTSEEVLDESSPHSNRAWHHRLKQAFDPDGQLSADGSTIAQLDSSDA